MIWLELSYARKVSVHLVCRYAFISRVYDFYSWCKAAQDLMAVTDKNLLNSRLNLFWHQFIPFSCHASTIFGLSLCPFFTVLASLIYLQIVIVLLLDFDMPGWSSSHDKINKPTFCDLSRSPFLHHFPQY